MSKPMNAKELQAVMKRWNLDQPALATLLGVSQPTVSNMLAGATIRPLYARILRDPEMVKSLLREPP
jgi:predicted transcriptional regulator